jgi:hemerythrin-like metal-binding protein
MASKRLPFWLYESLPYLYIAFGVLTLALNAGWIPSLCGVFLVSAGLLILRMRIVYRRARATRLAESAASAAPEDAGAHAAGNLIQLVWRPKYECGDPVIDAQHRHLFGLGNELVNALLANRNRSDLVLLLDEFLAHVVRHFKSEEEIAEQEGHDDLEVHRAIHRDLLARARSIIGRFQSGERNHGEIVTFVTTDVIIKHIVTEDLAFLDRGA